MTLRGSLPTTVSFFLIVGWLIVMFGGPVLVAVKVQQECSDMAIALSTQAPLVLQHEAVASWYVLKFNADCAPTINHLSRMLAPASAPLMLKKDSASMTS